MKWNAFDLISPAIQKTKKRLFPFDFKEWFKLMIISLLAGMKGSNFNVYSGNAGDYASNFRKQPTSPQGEDVVGKIDFSEAFKTIIKKYWWIGGIIFLVLFIFINIFTYIRSVFSFIFIDALINKESEFTFRKNHSKGLSLFLFKFVITIISLAVFVGLACPYFYHAMKSNPILTSVGIAYIIFSVIALIIYFLLLWILFLFLQDFVIPYMYSKEVPTIFALKQIWKEILENKVEILVYWLARLLLGIGIGIISIFITGVIILAVFILAGIIFLVGFLFYKLVGGLAVFIFLGAIIGFILVLILIVSMLMLILPLSVFYRYFQLFNFEKLTNIKILKEF